MDRLIQNLPDMDQGYGGFTPEQGAVLKPFIAGKRVLYPGAGMGQKAKLLLKLGASHITCVEKERLKAPPGKSVTWMQGYLEDMPEALYDAQDVLLLSWVHPYGLQITAGIREGFDKIPQIIYLGKNTDGILCANKSVFHYLRGRSVSCYVPDRRNTMILYGDPVEGRDLMPEERAGLLAWEPSAHTMSYEEIEVK